MFHLEAQAFIEARLRIRVRLRAQVLMPHN